MLSHRYGSCGILCLCEIKETYKSEFVRNRNFEFSDELKTDILTVFFVDKEKVMCYLI